MKIDQATILFSEEVDCCALEDGNNYLEVSTHDGGGGAYLVIKTERWAIDPDEFDEFLKRLRLVLDVANGKTTKTKEAK